MKSGLILLLAVLIGSACAPALPPRPDTTLPSVAAVETFPTHLIQTSYGNVYYFDMPNGDRCYMASSNISCVR